MKNLEDILFIDIETVPQFPNYEAMDERWQQLWDKKAKYVSREEESSEEIYNKAGIYAEFGRIICISAAFIKEEDGEAILRVKSFYGDNEKEVLAEFCELLTTKFNKQDQYLCAHNGKEFDYPYLCRRILVNGLELPNILDLSGKKPWEVKHFDTMQMWKFGDFKSYTSLDLLAASFDIPTPKSDMDGSMVYATYYQENGLERIKNYCQRDVVTLTNIFLRMKNRETILDKNIVIVE